MSDLTVEDILNRAPKTLFERAKAAHIVALERERLRREQEEADLTSDTITFLRDKFEMPDADIADIRFTAGDLNKERSQVLFKLEGMDCRATYLRTKIDTIEYGATGKHDIWDLRFRLEVNPAGSRDWKEVDSLESLGSLLS